MSSGTAMWSGEDLWVILVEKFRVQLSLKPGVKWRELGWRWQLATGNWQSWVARTCSGNVCGPAMSWLCIQSTCGPSKLPTSGPHPRPESEPWCGHVPFSNSAQVVPVYAQG